jgi:hypothetical protein
VSCARAWPRASNRFPGRRFRSTSESAHRANAPVQSRVGGALGRMSARLSFAAPLGLLTTLDDCRSLGFEGSMSASSTPGVVVVASAAAGPSWAAYAEHLLMPSEIALMSSSSTSMPSNRCV